MNLSDKFADELTKYGITIARFDAGLQKRILAFLNEVEVELENQIRRASMNDAVRATTKQRRMEKLLVDVRGVLRDAHRPAEERLHAELIAFSKVSSDLVLKSMNVVMKADIFSLSISAKELRAIVNGPIADKRLLKDWWSQQRSSLQVNFDREMRLGLIAGETNDELVRRVIGGRNGTRKVVIDGVTRKVPAYTGGIMETSRRSAMTLVRTAVQGVSNQVLDELYEENDDLLRGVAAITTLDLRTSHICQSRTGASWSLETGLPLPESTYRLNYPGPPPWHPACRTVLGPVTKTWEQLVEEASGQKLKLLNTVPDSVKASADGVVPGSLGLQGFLNRQSVTGQKRALGLGRWQLWKDGQLNLHQMVDQSGRILSLEELVRLAS